MKDRREEEQDHEPFVIRKGGAFVHARAWFTTTPEVLASERVTPFAERAKNGATRVVRRNGDIVRRSAGHSMNGR